MAYSTNTQVYRTSGLTSTAISSTNIDAFITEVDAWIDVYTGKTYNTATAQINYFDNIENDYNRSWMDEGGIITGSKPFFDSKDKFFLNPSPVTKVSDVWILAKDLQLDQVLSFDDSAGTYTDNTTEANTVGGTPFNAFASTVGTSDILYVGSQYKFLALTLNLVTVGVGGVVVWEYYNDSTWTTLTVTEDTSGADDLNASGKLTWSLPRDWAEVEVNGVSKFWVRSRVTTGHSTSPTVRNIEFDYDTVIQTELNVYDYTWNPEGTLILRNRNLVSDMRKLRVNYSAGSASVPTRIQELSCVLASIKAVVSLMGGSFDDISGYQIGSLQVSKGEPYINLKSGLAELYKRRDVLLNQIGREFTVAGV